MNQKEIELLKALFQSNYQTFSENPEETKAFLGIGQAKAITNTDDATLATWTAIARAVMNTNEFITRN